MKMRKQELNRELQRIVKVLIEDYQPEKIILFGSLANGRVGEWSDIDLVIIKNTRKRFMERLKEVIKLTMPEVGVDFLVYTPTEVERAVQEGRVFLKKEILGRGMVIYNRE